MIEEIASVPECHDHNKLRATRRTLAIYKIISTKYDYRGNIVLSNTPFEKAIDERDEAMQYSFPVKIACFTQQIPCFHKNREFDDNLLNLNGKIYKIRQENPKHSLLFSK
jgi:hypothetical protein